MRGLRAAGFQVDWITDLFNKRLNYRAAIPKVRPWPSMVENEAPKPLVWVKTADEILANIARFACELRKLDAT